jgi:hypothetical protein
MASKAEMLKITLWIGGKKALIHCKEGGSISLQKGRNSYVYNVGKLGAKAGLQVNIAKLKKQSGSEALIERPEQAFTLVLGKKFKLERALPEAIQVDRFDPPLLAGRTTGTCCVTCNNVRACGCAVYMDCGSCCTGECC